MSVNCRSCFTLETYSNTGFQRGTSNFNMDCEQASHFFKELDKQSDAPFKVSNHEISLSSFFYKKKLKFSDPLELSATAKKLDSIMISENKIKNSFKCSRTCTY